MKTEKPILFSAPMILKIIADKKTVTRRIVKPQPPDYIDFFEFMKGGFEGYYIKVSPRFRPFVLPRGRVAYTDIKAKYVPGDRLWVRETWGIPGFNNDSGYEICVKYRADNAERNWIDLDNEELWERLIKREETYDKKHGNKILWRPSILIPRAVSRISLDVTDCRIERLHELDDDEAQREGFKNRENFIKLWDSLNKKRSFPWEANPWVYRIEFKRAK